MYTVEEVLDWPSVSVVDMLVYTQLVKSKSEAKRMLKQGAIKVDGIRIISDHAQVVFSPDRNKHAVIDSP